jgi:hypothetical protein
LETDFCFGTEFCTGFARQNPRQAFASLRPQKPLKALLCVWKVFMNKTEFAFESFRNIQELIRFTDQKAGAVLLFTGVLLPFYESMIRNVEFIGVETWSIMSIIAFLTSLITLLLLLATITILIFLILKPRLATNYGDNEKSLFYFEHIASANKDSLVESFQKLDEYTELKAVMDQTYEISKILVSKTKYLSYSFITFFASCIGLLLTYITIGSL